MGVPTAYVDAGSSPRVRGTPRAGSAPAGPSRIIPACAGNSAGATPRGPRGPDHPRVCGELASWNQTARNCDGSSPRVRGTQVFDQPFATRRRIIPACAGNSIFASPRSRFRSDHPRVCGELVRSRVMSMSMVGSSPRVRGTRRHGGSDRAGSPGSSPRVRGTLATPPLRIHLARIIPACAGNSCIR